MCEVSAAGDGERESKSCFQSVHAIATMDDAAAAAAPGLVTRST
jgi:hypothetical protein